MLSGVRERSDKSNSVIITFRPQRNISMFSPAPSLSDALRNIHCNAAAVATL